MLEDVILPDLISKFGPRLKVWSAACSTGDEPYSLAMVLAKKVPMRDIKIIATDLDEQVLEKAKDGVYGENSIKGLPKEFQDKYFEKMGDRFYKISDDIKRCVDVLRAELVAVVVYLVLHVERAVDIERVATAGEHHVHLCERIVGELQHLVQVLVKCKIGRASCRERV